MSEVIWTPYQWLSAKQVKDTLTKLDKGWTHSNVLAGWPSREAHILSRTDVIVQSRDGVQSRLL